MTPKLFLDVAVTPALALLPEAMRSAEAKSLILSICLHESSLRHRRQRNGPARGYGQFEPGPHAAIQEVLTNQKTAAHAEALCARIDIQPTWEAVYDAIEYHDLLMAGMARLLLWTIPRPLPKEAEADEAYRQYLEAWKPGRRRPDDWPADHRTAWGWVHHGERA